MKKPKYKFQIGDIITNEWNERKVVAAIDGEYYMYFNIKDDGTIWLNPFKSANKYTWIHSKYKKWGYVDMKNEEVVKLFSRIQQTFLDVHRMSMNLLQDEMVPHIERTITASDGTEVTL